jgi:hypothetical protein
LKNKWLLLGILGLLFAIRVPAQDAVPGIASTLAQKAEFSADMQIMNGTERTQMMKVFVGNKRARFDRSTQDDKTNRIGSIIIDFDHQFLFLVIPQAKMYLQIAGSSGTPFYRAAWMFRPSSSDNPCGGWVSEANQRGITLRCHTAGQDSVGGRPTSKWDATTPDGGHGSLWYDQHLNFIVKVLRTSKGGIESGYELQNIKEGTQPQTLFEFPSDYREFTLNRLIDVLTGLGQWQ